VAAPVSGCCDTCCEEEGWFGRLRAKFRRHDDCCDTCGDACDECGFGARLKAKWRGMFRRDDCCDTCAPCCDGAPHAVTAPGKGQAPAAGKGAESIPAPKEAETLKEMPKGKKTEGGTAPKGDTPKKDTKPPAPKPEDSSLLQPVPSGSSLIIDQ
jgi:hypothetical protein